MDDNKVTLFTIQRNILMEKQRLRSLSVENGIILTKIFKAESELDHALAYIGEAIKMEEVERNQT